MSIDYWAIVPAAGSGSRMQSEKPKQYIEIDNHAIIEYSLEALLQHKKIQKIIVALDVNDRYWHDLPVSKLAKIVTVSGGNERVYSVLNALQALSGLAQADDWVLVHDAARPLLSCEALQKLIDKVDGHPVGGILGVPVVDTLKYIEQDNICKTVSREHLWAAQTPQMFRYGLLKDAIEAALHNNQEVTDESSAVQRAGHKPIIVEGDSFNIKLTRPSDLELIKHFLMRAMSL